MLTLFLDIFLDFFVLPILHASRSKIVFKTAGVLLEEMRDRGLNALNYKVIVLDEVHERSVESDLVLVCVKQFLSKNHDLRSALCFSSPCFLICGQTTKDATCCKLTFLGGHTCSGS